MANHRLKCFLTLQTRNVRLTDTNLASCFYTDGRFEYRLGNDGSHAHGSAFHLALGVPYRDSDLLRARGEGPVGCRQRRRATRPMC